MFVAVNAEMLPMPFAANPIAVFELVHVKVPPAGLLTKLVAATLPLLQITILVGTVTVGKGLTVTVTVAEPVHPEAVLVSVYVVVDPGVTETGVPAKLPGIHV